MTAYNFHLMFVHPIVARIKRQTMRAHRRGGRHARPGELIQLYRGMRTKNCEKIIPDPICTALGEVEFDLRETDLERFLLIRDFDSCHLRVNGIPIEMWSDKNSFAVSDGFPRFDEMVVFWLKVHGPVRFEGVIVFWEDAHA